MSRESRAAGRPLYAVPAFSLVALSIGLAVLWPGPFPTGLTLMLLAAPFALDILLKGGRSLPLYMFLMMGLAFLTPSVPYTYPPLWAEEIAPTVLWLSLSLLVTLRLLARSENEASHRRSTMRREGEYLETATAGLRPSRRLGRFPELTRDPVYLVLSRYFGEAFSGEYDRTALTRYLSDVSSRSPGLKLGLSTGAARREEPHAGRASIIYELGLVGALALFVVTAPLWMLWFEFPWAPVPAFEVTQPEFIALLLAMLAGLSIVAKWLIRREDYQKRR